MEVEQMISDEERIEKEIQNIKRRTKTTLKRLKRRGKLSMEQLVQEREFGHLLYMRKVRIPIML